MGAGAAGRSSCGSRQMAGVGAVPPCSAARASPRRAKAARCGSPSSCPCRKHLCAQAKWGFGWQQQRQLDQRSAMDSAASGAGGSTACQRPTIMHVCILARDSSRSCRLHLPKTMVVRHCAGAEAV